jgi:arylsulfatase A-like enzyme
MSVTLLGAVVALCVCASGCRSRPAAEKPEQAVWGLYRFDDQFASAASVSSAQAAPGSARMAERVVWDFTEKKVTWDLVRGRMGFRPGELVVKGEGSTPVIVSPANPPVDWSRYRSILIRMIAEGGTEVKLKLGNLELKQKLGPPMEYLVYRFDLDLAESAFNFPMAIMPTDSLFAPVAIDFIELVPRKATFTEAAGRSSVGKREEYRNVLYAQSPSSITYEVAVPDQARLHFGLGVAGKPVTFRVTAGAAGRELFSKTIADPDAWEDAEVDLSALGGRSEKLVFQTSSDAAGAIGFWANPLIATTAPKSRPNILMYVVCTLRPDHTSVYGYSRETTPFLKQLAATASVFEDCQAQASWTKPSVASLMTSLYGINHGIVKDTDIIPKGAVTLAERLRAGGYVSAGIAANPFAGRMTGLERGFDYMLEYPVVQRHRTDAADRGTDSAAINRVILPWIERHRDEPFFLYIQSTDPHAPYRPPPPFEAMFANPAETPQFDRDYDRLRDLRGYGGGASVSRAECRARGIDPDAYRRRAIDRYDGEIAHNDRSIAQLFDKLRELRLLDNTLVVIASDHGEEFWEHGYSAHGHSLYQELSHTLLMMWNPKLLPVPRRIAEPVQLIDVLPTVLDLLQMEAGEVVQGQSLVPLLRGQPFRRKGAVMASRFAHHNAKPGGIPEYRTGTVAWIDRDWKFLYRDQPARAGLRQTEMYDRQRDRAETKDLAAERPELNGKLGAAVREWIDGQAEVRKLLGPRSERPIDPQMVERLRSLGYIGGK